MKKYTIEFKLKLIKECIEGNHATTEIAPKYGVAEIHLRRWVKLYKLHGIEGLEHKCKKYDRKFKEKVLKYMKDNQLSFLETAMIFNIPKDTTVGYWYKQYQNRELFKPMKEVTMNKSENPEKKNLKELQKENEKLRAENAYLKKLQALVQERIDQEKKKK